MQSALSLHLGVGGHFPSQLGSCPPPNHAHTGPLPAAYLSGPAVPSTLPGKEHTHPELSQARAQLCFLNQDSRKTEQRQVTLFKPRSHLLGPRLALMLGSLDQPLGGAWLLPLYSRGGGGCERLSDRGVVTVMSDFVVGWCFPLRSC